MPVNYSTAVPVNPSAQLQVALKLIEAGASVNKDAFKSLVTSDYVHIYLPENASLPKLKGDEFVDQMAVITGLITSFSLDVKDIIEAPGVVTLYMAVDMKTKGGNVNDQELLTLLYIAEQPDGSFKATKCREFVDTLKFTTFGQAVQKELAASSV